MGTFFSGLIPKVNRAIGGADTVSAGAYAVVSYIPTGISGLAPDGDGGFCPPPVTRYFGPGQAIPASFTSQAYQINQTVSPWHTVNTITYSLASGVEFINS